MKLEFAPMEGLTSYIHRQLHHDLFPGVDRYYTPFLSPTAAHVFTPREQAEIAPENNRGICLVPQILTKEPGDFLWAAEKLQDMGYEEVNLNLGCPSGTVTAKGKGAGMLRDPEALDWFLEQIFEKAAVKISVKTRLGVTSPEEFPALLEVFNRYPIAELIIHPRVREDYYKGKVRMEAFAYGLKESKNPVCYNGNLTTAKEVRDFSAAYPQVKTLMLGRGLIADPAFAGKAKGGEPADRETLREFHDRLFVAYCDAYGGPRNALFRMKEVWLYQKCLFRDSEKLWKKLRKTTSLAEYQDITARFFEELELLTKAEADW